MSVTTRRAVIYARISDDRSGEGLGVARQDEDCTALCDRLGWEIVDRYIENDISAYSGKKRPLYDRMLNDLTAGRANAVVCWHPDRLHRSPKELEHFITIIENTKAAVATVTAGTYDLTTPAGRMVARTLGNHARYESEQKSERIRRKHQQLAEAGIRHGGGYRQFGYETDLTTIVPAEADLLRQAAKRILAGETVHGVCSTWNAQGLRSTKNRPWTQVALKRMLTAYSTAGLRYHNGAIHQGTWPAILDEATWRRLRIILLDPNRRTAPSNARKYLLTGILRCGRCGAKMVARPKADKRRQYVCARGPGFHGCGKMAALAEPLEEAVEHVLFERIDSPRVAQAIAAAMAADENDTLVDELAADEAALEQLARDHYVDGIISRGQFLAASQALEARVAAARRRLVREQEVMPAAGWAGKGAALRRSWMDLALSQRIAIVGAFIESVTIGPAIPGLNRFDADRIKPSRGGGIAWRY